LAFSGKKEIAYDSGHYFERKHKPGGNTVDDGSLARRAYISVIPHHLETELGEMDNFYGYCNKCNNK
jgi:hypothetical protein